MKWILAEEEHNRGSADPFVARTVIQAGRIVSYYELGEDRERKVAHVFNQLRRHLHQCDDIGRRLVSEINRKSEALQERLSENELQGILHLPAAENLTNDVETFLYHAKLAFRELKALFLHTLGKRFKTTTQYKHIANWADKRFGKDDLLTIWLKKNCDWIEQLVNSRNAIEHPECHTLEIKNFYADGGVIRAPTWSLDGEAPKSLLRDMEILAVNILEFSEFLLLYCLKNVKDISPIIIVEIPESKRDNDAPMRFIATLTENLDENGMYKGRK